MIREMAIADVLKLPSVDSHGASFGGPYSSWSLRDTLDSKNVEGPEYDAIRAEIVALGYNRVPIHVDYGEYMAEIYSVMNIPEGMLSSLMMGNGHHRLKIMIEEGLDTVLVTDEASESTDTPAELQCGGTYAPCGPNCDGECDGDGYYDE